MNILSLFDGMSCGQIALNRANIKYDKYFASEINKYAIKITQKNYPDTIQLGDITQLDTTKLPIIDLLFGGSPCQSFSKTGDGSGFDGKSKLFWEFIRILNKIKPKYFLLENVVMKKEWQDIITKELEVEPIKINSKLVSAQNRPRLYWTNIPNITQPKDLGLTVEDVIECNFSSEPIRYLELEFAGRKRKTLVAKSSGKSACLTATMYKKQIGTYIKNDKGEIHTLSPTDCEILQTVPLDYTKGVSNTQRYIMLGNGWTVDVIAHIFSFLPKEFKK